jgi:hypothetical protein
VTDASERVRLVAVRTGTFYGQAMTAGNIYIVAGGGGTILGNGPATQAFLGYPISVAVAPAGDLIVTDLQDNRAQWPNAHATISGNSSFQNASPCPPSRSIMTTSAPFLRSATAQRVAFLRKNGSRVPATK